MLGHFDIRPKQIKIGGLNRNGYQRDQFDAVFAAYFPPNRAQPPSQTSTSSTALTDQEKTAFQTSTSAHQVEFRMRKFPKRNKAVDPVDL